MTNLSEMTTESLQALATEAFRADDDAQVALVAAELRQRGEEVEDIERILTMRETAEVLRSHGDWATGCEVTETAREWVEAGFAPAQIEEWLNAGCYRAWDAESLREAGITPAQASAHVEDEDYRGRSHETYRLVSERAVAAARVVAVEVLGEDDED
jgi:hypothetical protein